jgi:hypothetical protein
MGGVQLRRVLKLLYVPPGTYLRISFASFQAVMRSPRESIGSSKLFKRFQLQFDGVAARG